VVQAVHPGGARGQLLVENYINVVVFSQQGVRPLPNMLSGSDLVGLCMHQLQLLTGSQAFVALQAAIGLGWPCQTCTSLGGSVHKLVNLVERVIAVIMNALLMPTVDVDSAP
jgi:hypothetical protein